MDDSHDTGDLPKKDADLAEGGGADDMASLVDRSASLNWLMDQHAQQSSSSTPAVVLPWKDSADDAKEPFDPRTARRWPFELHSIDYYGRLLIARAVGGTMPANVDEGSLTATWKTLTNSEIQALWSVGEADSGKASTAADEILARVATQRLRARTAIRQADEIHALDRRIEVDDTLATQIASDLKVAASDWMDPLIRESIHGESERVKDARVIRKDLAYARQEIDRAVARMRGLVDPKIDMPSPPSQSGKAKGRSPPGMSEVRHERSQGALASVLKGVAAFAVLTGIIFLFARDFLIVAAGNVTKPATPTMTAPLAASPVVPVMPGSAVPAVAVMPGAVATTATTAPTAAALPPPVLSAREKECIKMSGPRQTLEPSTAHVYGTMLMKDNSTALMADASRHEQEVRVGDYLGAHCWKVSVIDIDSITLMSNETGTSGPKTMRMAVTSQHDQRNKHGRW